MAFDLLVGVEPVLFDNSQVAAHEVVVGAAVVAGAVREPNVDGLVGEGELGNAGENGLAGEDEGALVDADGDEDELVDEANTWRGLIVVDKMLVVVAGQEHKVTEDVEDGVAFAEDDEGNNEDIVYKDFEPLDVVVDYD